MHATLTFRQERFVFEYLKDQNATEKPEEMSGSGAGAMLAEFGIAEIGQDLSGCYAARARPVEGAGVDSTFTRNDSLGSNSKCNT